MCISLLLFLRYVSLSFPFPFSLFPFPFRFPFSVFFIFYALPCHHPSIAHELIQPLYPAGLILSLMGRTEGSAVRIYQITYIVGFFLGGSLHLIVNRLFPLSGLGINEDFDVDVVVEGTSPVVTSSEDGEEGKRKGGEVVVVGEKGLDV